MSSSCPSHTKVCILIHWLRKIKQNRPVWVKWAAKDSTINCCIKIRVLPKKLVSSQIRPIFAQFSQIFLCHWHRLPINELEYKLYWLFMKWNKGYLLIYVYVCSYQDSFILLGIQCVIHCLRVCIYVDYVLCYISNRFFGPIARPIIHVWPYSTLYTREGSLYILVGCDQYAASTILLPKWTILANISTLEEYIGWHGRIDRASKKSYDWAPNPI